MKLVYQLDIASAVLKHGYKKLSTKAVSQMSKMTKSVPVQRPQAGMTQVELGANGKLKINCFWVNVTTCTVVLQLREVNYGQCI